ncbi:GntR family transcriptional regulator [Roseinatronobacter alkalisoli]|uniref:GntR family transcriptional regulator n=1 Tax=Roseinatronobacter alkalisoli TaxID=3028235 RepID=A0ABT5T8B8_9RHOB|nr:GntR family transcriptional regulator [Roseinatronobacter sp. HJB301]MDD7971363.1 GntR family transcriptional regulator [Roseinatronobacter sp. HJB301]
MPWLAENANNEAVARICDRVWLAVVQRSLRPGTRLKEEDLAEVFGVSRARVRQALSLLEKDGLVSLVPNRGACIAEPSVSEARDAFYTRGFIEKRLVERLCHTATDADIAALRAHIARERAAHAGQDSEAIIRLSGEFHLLIARLTDAEFLTKILRTLTTRTSLITAMYQSETTQTCGPDEHEAIVTAIESRDVVRAAEMMEHHLHHLESALQLNDAKSPAAGLREALRLD